MIQKFDPKSLVLSTGMDTYDGDPLGKFHVTRDGFHQIGQRIAGLKLPTTIIMEGGYANQALGTNIVTLLENFK
jgi:acetoin utilization deacetylase AcuC-like enzyme